MRFAFTEEHELARNAIRDLLGDHCSPQKVRASWESVDGKVPGLWEKLVGMGVVGMSAPAKAGGLDAHPIDTVLLFEELGRAAAPLPLVEHMAIGLPLLAAFDSSPLVETWLPRAVEGEAMVTVGFGEDPLVVDAEVADLLLLQNGDGLHALLPATVDRTSQPSVVGNRKLSRVSFQASEKTLVASGDSATKAIGAAMDRGTVAVAAQLVGIGQSLLDRTVEYAKVRTQFGKAIGAFQAVKHPIVDAYLALDFARPLVYRAAYGLSHEEADASIRVSMAKAAASEAALGASKMALQLHGAIGYSYEYDLHLWMKLAWALASSFGDAAAHRGRVAAHYLDGGQKG